MSNHDLPTPPAPAEVCERLKKLANHHSSEEQFIDDRHSRLIKFHHEATATLTAALALIEQGEKDRERLEEETRIAKSDRDSVSSSAFENQRTIARVNLRNCELRREIGNLQTILKIIPPDRLRLLAAWLDYTDTLTRQSVTEMQDDLRKMAQMSDALLNAGHEQPTPESK